MNTKFEHEVIFCIVNIGYSESVMDAARKQGACGGTVLNARGTANPVAEKFFGISVEPEKEMVMIVVPTKIKENVLHALYQEVGLDTAGQGIAFSLPVDSVVGISECPPESKKEKKVVPQQEQLSIV